MIKVLSFSLLVAVVSAASLGPQYNQGGVFSDSSRLSEAASGFSSEKVAGSDAFAAGSLSKESSSKSSASESGRNSRIKSGSSYAVGGQSVGASAYDATKIGQMDYSSINKGVGGFGGGYGGVDQVGLASKDAAYQSGQKFGASAGYATGSSNTEIEKSEYNKNAASESRDVTQGSFANKGSSFGAESQNNFANRKDLAQDQYQAGGVGGFGLGGGYVSSDQSRLSESAAGSSSALAAGSDKFAAGDISKVSSSKSSSSESGKSSKIKSGSNYATGSQTVGGSAYDASKASQLDYGASSVGLGGGFGGGISKVGLASSDISASKGQAFGASSGYAVGSSNLEAEESEYNKNAQSESYDATKGSFAAGSSDFTKAQQSGFANNKDASRDRFVRVRRSSRYFNEGARLYTGLGNIFAGQVASNSQLSEGAFAGLATASTGYSTGKVSKVSSSKSSSSESNKSTKIKTGTNFQAGNQNLAASTYDASKSNQLNYGASATGLSGTGISSVNEGLSANENTKVNQQAIGASTNFMTGSSNTEIEQSESQKHSESETNEAEEGTFANSGSAYGIGQQVNYAQNQQYSDQTGLYGSGGDGNSGIIAENVNKLSSSSLGTSSGVAAVSNSATVGVVNKRKSSKNSSSESNKGTKIKTGSNFQAVNQNVAASAYDASKSNQLNYGASTIVNHATGTGSTNVGLSNDETSSVSQQTLGASTNSAKGSSNSEIEQTESQKNSESETNEAEEVTYSNSGSTLGIAQTDYAETQKNKEQTSAEILGSKTGRHENNALMAGTINDSSSSSMGTSSGFAVASSGKVIGTTERKTSDKSSLSESNKGTKIQTGNNFNLGGLNLQSHQLGSSQLSSFNFGENLGNLFEKVNLNIGLSANNNIKKHQNLLNTSLGFLQGSSNSDIEQTELYKKSENDANEASRTSYVGSDIQNGNTNESAISQNENVKNSSKHRSCRH